MTATKTKAPAKPEKYRLVSGIHYEPVPGFEGDYADPERIRKYVAGDVVVATRDLVERFPNKFRYISAEELNPPIDAEARRVEVDLMIAGGHWVEDDRQFLQNIPDDNFERLKARFASAITSKSSESKTLSTLGEDCTSNFQMAYDHGFNVFKNALGKFQVTRKGYPDKPVNKTALDQSGVDKFIETFLKEK